MKSRREDCRFCGCIFRCPWRDGVPDGSTLEARRAAGGVSKTVATIAGAAATNEGRYSRRGVCATSRKSRPAPVRTLNLAEGRTTGNAPRRLRRPLLGGSLFVELRRPAQGETVFGGTVSAIRGNSRCGVAFKHLGQARIRWKQRRKKTSHSRSLRN